MGSALTYTPTMRQVNDWLRYLLSTDTSIKTHCENNYGRAQKLFIGVNLENPPGESDAPFLTIERDRHLGGTLNEVRRGVSWELYKFVISVGIYCVDAMLEDPTDTVCEVLSLEGIEKSETLAYLVRNVLDAGLPDQLLIESCNVLCTDASQLPMYYTQLDITISVPRCLGGSVTVNPPP